MKILVTGATGFLGRHLGERLIDEGHETVELGSQQCDLTIPGSLEEVLGEEKFDEIFHLASWTRAGNYCAEHPGSQWIKNQKIDTNVLDWWQSFQPEAKMITIGSSCAYDPDLPLTEENYLKGTPTPQFLGYGYSKRMLYVGLSSLAKEEGLEGMHFIPSTLYGPEYHTDGRPMHFIYDLMRKTLRAKHLGEDLVLWGDGSQTREIMHVNDFIEAMLTINSASKNQLVNVGSKRKHAIREFAEMICDEVGYDFGKVQYDTSKPSGAKSKYLVLDKMDSLVGEGYREKDLREGIRETVSWMLNNRGVFLKK